MNNVCNDSIFVSIVVQYWCHSWHGISVVYDTVLMSLDNYDQNIPENQSNSMIKRLEMRLTRYVFSSVTPKRPQSLPPNSRKRSASLQLRFIQNHCAPDINIRNKSYKLPLKTNKSKVPENSKLPGTFLLSIPPLWRGIPPSTSSVVSEKRSTELLWVDILTNEMICVWYEKNYRVFPHPHDHSMIVWVRILNITNYGI